MELCTVHGARYIIPKVVQNVGNGAQMPLFSHEVRHKCPPGGPRAHIVAPLVTFEGLLCPILIPFFFKEWSQNTCEPSFWLLIVNHLKTLSQIPLHNSLSEGMVQTFTLGFLRSDWTQTFESPKNASWVIVILC